jgi:dienelactone hydrolase
LEVLMSHFPSFVRALTGSLSLLAALGCASDGSPSTGDLFGGSTPACEPGEVFECTCPGGVTGSQSCSTDGLSVDSCSCDPGGPSGTGGSQSDWPSATGGSQTDGTGGTPNTGTGGVPTTGGTGGLPTTGGSGGSIAPPVENGTCCPSGACLCHGPEPTAQSASVDGPYGVESYTSGFSNKPAYLGGTIYYPTNAEPPFAGVVICPGWTASQSSMAGWGPFLGSHGIVVMTIDTNTPLDDVALRAVALRDALASLKEENGRGESPLQGKLSDRFGFMGWSMGGGATWINGAEHPELIRTGISLAGHHLTAGGAQIASGTTVASMLLAGALDSAILGGADQSQTAYEAMAATTPKILYEMANEDHYAWGTPTTTNGGALGRYALAFQKVFLEGDERYRPLLLVEGPGASDWRSTVQ